MNAKERVVLHICTRDRATELYGLLQSLREQTFRNWDIIIIDEFYGPDGVTPSSIYNHYFIQNMLQRIQLEGHKVVVQKSDVGGVVRNRNQAFKLQEDHFPDSPYSVRIDDDSLADPKYIQKLYDLIITDDKIGAVGGVVPTFSGPNIVRSTSIWKKRYDRPDVFNYMEFDDKGNIHVNSDDGGIQWISSNGKCIFPSHHLRSSFMIRNTAAKEVGYYDDAFGSGSCFREESDFSLKLIAAGYKLYTDITAICWHLRTPSGGCRHNPQDYAASVQICDTYFKKKWKEKYEEGFRL